MSNRPRTSVANPQLACIACAAILASVSTGLAEDVYTHTNLGVPPGADTTTAIRMNNLGHVVGYSIYYGQGEPSIKPWVWTPEDGFTVLPPPPDMFLGRARAMDISDTGIIAGDGGFDSGIAWRYENGEYETFGTVGGMFIAYLGGVNDAGDVAGTAKDAQITTEDEVFVDINGAGTIHVTPGAAGGRGTDINNVGQVCGYSQGPLSGFEAFVWDQEEGMHFLGTAGLAYSFGYDMNDLGQVVGRAQSASGNTVNSWIYTPGSGQQQLPERGVAAINNAGHAVGTITCCGPDEPWIWTPSGGSQMTFDLFNYVVAGLSGPSSRDINDAGQILLNAYDNNANGYRPIVLTPIAGGTGACCLADSGCIEGITEAACVAQAGTFAGNGTLCTTCIPVGACCLTNGDCIAFQSESDCAALVGTYQGDDTSCGNVSCPVGVPNDDCADAIAIELGDTPFTTLGSSTDGPNLPQSCSEPIGLYFGMDVWFSYQPEGDGVLTVSTCNQADYDTRLAAYTGVCGNLEIADCNFDGPGCIPYGSIMEFPVTCDEPILVRVGSFSVYTGTGILSLTFTGDPCVPTCTGDTNGDQVVDVTDVVNVILAWGTADAAADVNMSGRVDVDDLVMVILHWGACP